MHAPRRPQPAFADLLAESGYTENGEQITAQPPSSQYVPQLGDDQTTEEHAAAARNTTRRGSSGRFAPQTQAAEEPYNPNDEIDDLGLHAEHEGEGNDAPDEESRALGLPDLGPVDGSPTADVETPADDDDDLFGDC